MKRFDAKASSDRIIGNLKKKPNWQNMQKDGATEQFCEALGESFAESARYGEQLLREMKWDTSKNFSSVKHMARLVGKKYDRKHSAVGTLIVSHSDDSAGPNAIGSPRYANLGKSLLNIDQESNWDDLKLDTTKTSSAYLTALTPYMRNDVYQIPIGAKFTSNAGLTYIAAEKKVIENFSQEWSVIKNDKDLLTEFRASGGWEGYKYLSVPVVQGQDKVAYLGESDNTASQSFVLATLNIEAADSYYTKQFLYLEVETKAGIEIWTEVYHLSTCDATDKKFEVNILDDLSGTEIKFGDGITGAIPEEGAKLTLHYLETAGSEGNVVDPYFFNSSIDGAIIPEGLNISLGCQNMWAIINGSDLEDLSKFKNSAEVAYEKNYEIIHTYPEFQRKLNLVSPVPILKSRVKSYLKPTQVNNTTIYIPTIGVTGLSGNLAKLNNTEKAIFNKVVNNAINDKIVSNKQVAYVDPNILAINSSISIELKEPVISNESFITDMEDYLQQNVGKYNLDAIEKYQQVTLIKNALEHSDNIASIDCVDLITLGNPTVDITNANLDPAGGTQAIIDKTNNGTTGGLRNFIIFKWEMPEINIDATGAEGYCFKNVKDGNAISLILNMKIFDKEFTFLLHDAGQELAETPHIYNAVTKSGVAYNLKDIDRYTLEQLQVPKYTFTRGELRFPQTKLNIKEVTDVEHMFYKLNPSATSLSFVLAIPVMTVATWVGYAETVDAQSVKVELENAIANNLAKCTIGFEPTDKTMDTDEWNSIWYYDNIKVAID